MGDLERNAVTWWQFFDYCFNHNPAALACESFWAKAIGAFVAFGVVMVSIGIWKAVDYKRKARRAAIAEWQRNSIDEVGIREVTWAGEAGLVDNETPDDELVTKIREGVEQRKREIASNRSPAEPTGA